MTRRFCYGRFCLDPLQQGTGWFLVGVLRHQLALERFREDGLIEMIDQFAGARRLAREAGDLNKGALDACSQRA